MPTTYDADIIQKHADRLYSDARTLMLKYALLAGTGGAVAIWVAGVFSETDVTVAAIVVGGVLGLMGAAVGNGKAFELRLQAQLALCQRQIELNTRG